MPDYFAQAVLRSNTGNTRDDNVNTFAVGGIGSIDLTSATEWKDAVKAFYDTLRTNSMLLGRTQSAHLFKIYEITAARPNYPKFEFTWALAISPGGVQMPLEVNLAVSYINTEATTIARGRRRGRIFISGHSEDANTSGRPVLTTVEALADAYTAYADRINANMGTFQAGVWSRASNNVWPIQEVFCDNEWDTVRSRGGRSTQRFTNTVVP